MLCLLLFAKCRTRIVLSDTSVDLFLLCFCKAQRCNSLTRLQKDSADGSLLSDMEHSNRLRSDVNDGLNKVDALLESLAKNSTIKGVTGNEIARMQAVAESTRKRMNEQNLTVAVMALMKSGTDPSLSSKNVCCP